MQLQATWRLKLLELAATAVAAGVTVLWLVTASKPTLLVVSLTVIAVVGGPLTVWALTYLTQLGLAPARQRDLLRTEEKRHREKAEKRDSEAILIRQWARRKDLAYRFAWEVTYRSKSLEGRTGQAEELVQAWITEARGLVRELEATGGDSRYSEIVEVRLRPLLTEPRSEDEIGLVRESMESIARELIMEMESAAAPA